MALGLVSSATSAQSSRETIRSRSRLFPRSAGHQQIKGVSPTSSKSGSLRWFHCAFRFVRPFLYFILCSSGLQLITKHIDDIDAFGDIGAMNVEAIAKALSKNRSL